MRVQLASVSPRASRSGARAVEFDSLTRMYLQRLSGWLTADLRVYADEAALFAGVKDLQRLPGGCYLAQCDSAGKMLSSEDLAAWLGQRREAGGALMLAVGPADGWSPEAIARADSRISFGPITLPHELARVVAAEQLYRAYTILEHHPYHAGH